MVQGRRTAVVAARLEGGGGLLELALHLLGQLARGRHDQAPRLPAPLRWAHPVALQVLLPQLYFAELENVQLLSLGRWVRLLIRCSDTASTS